MSREFTIHHFVNRCADDIPEEAYDKYYVAEGGTGVVFRHPTHPKKCIKVAKHKWRDMSAEAFKLKQIYRLIPNLVPRPYSAGKNHMIMEFFPEPSENRDKVIEKESFSRNLTPALKNVGIIPYDHEYHRNIIMMADGTFRFVDVSEWEIATPKIAAS